MVKTYIITKLELEKKKQLRMKQLLAVAAHIYDPKTQEAEAIVS